MGWWYTVLKNTWRSMIAMKVKVGRNMRNLFVSVYWVGLEDQTPCMRCTVICCAIRHVQKLDQSKTRCFLRQITWKGYDYRGMVKLTLRRMQVSEIMSGIKLEMIQCYIPGPLYSVSLHTAKVRNDIKVNVVKIILCRSSPTEFLCQARKPSCLTSRSFAIQMRIKGIPMMG